MPDGLVSPMLHAHYNGGTATVPALVREHLLENLLGLGSPHE